MKPLDYLLATVPMSFIPSFVYNTTEKLMSVGLIKTAVAEALKFFGILLLMAMFNFSESWPFDAT